MPRARLTPEIIAVAVEGYESQKARIDQKIAELRAMLDGGPAAPAATPEAPTRKRRKFSAAALRRMKEAQQRRWAKIRGESEPPAATEPPKPKRKLSRAGRAAIVAALKQRWAAKRAEAAKAQRAAKKSAIRKTAVKKPVVKAPPARAAKRRAPVKKAAAKTTPAPAQAVTEAVAQ